MASELDHTPISEEPTIIQISSNRQQQGEVAAMHYN